MHVPDPHALRRACVRQPRGGRGRAVRGRSRWGACAGGRRAAAGPGAHCVVGAGKEEVRIDRHARDGVGVALERDLGRCRGRHGALPTTMATPTATTSAPRARTRARLGAPTSPSGVSSCMCPASSSSARSDTAHLRIVRSLPAVSSRPSRCRVECACGGTNTQQRISARCALVRPRRLHLSEAPTASCPRTSSISHCSTSPSKPHVNTRSRPHGSRSSSPVQPAHSAAIVLWCPWLSECCPFPRLQTRSDPSSLPVRTCQDERWKA
jgi:hypothetical protein